MSGRPGNAGDNPRKIARTKNRGSSSFNTTSPTPNRVLLTQERFCYSVRRKLIRSAFSPLLRALYAFLMVVA
jgi:hypothetical protein